MNLIQKPPEPHEITAAIKIRNDCALIPLIRFFIKGEGRLMSKVNKMSEALTLQENLVVPTKEQAFKRQIVEAFIIENLDDTVKETVENEEIAE